MDYDLAKEYTEFEAPTFNGMSKEFIKIMTFAQTANLTNDNVDYYMNLKPTRQENETPEEFKQRSKFSKVLLKYRKHLYDYSVYKK